MVILIKYRNIFILIQKLGDTASTTFLTRGCSDSGFTFQAENSGKDQQVNSLHASKGC